MGMSASRSGQGDRLCAAGHAAKLAAMATPGSAVRHALRWLGRAGRWTRHLLGADAPGVVYVTDSFGWALYEEGRALERTIAPQGIRFTITDDYRAQYAQVVHYGSQFFLNQHAYRAKHPSCRLVFSWFHGDPDDPDPNIRDCYRHLAEARSYVDHVVTSCTRSLANLTAHGWPADRVTLIPLGVDTRRYPARTPADRTARRAQLDIPPDAFCVGSFQKDGVGWGEGLEPKLIKGPDVFVDVMARVFRERPNLFVLLTGPARGYVKAGLTRLGIPHRHVHLEEESQVAPHYDALDCYMIASRSEGGPKALMESMAKGVPVVSTRMGMPADVLADGRAGLLAEVGDAAALAAHVLRIAEDAALAGALVEEAHRRVQALDAPLLAQRHLDEVYRPLLAQIMR